ncbi:MAG: hypothetical protein LBS69_11140 [Prevotellaceae bacterium]|nr:hypothetical protein [Prevotellaceae bacterium]
MKTLYKSVKILLAALLVCLIFDACASRYSSNGRYRPRKNKNCNCPAYSHNIRQKNLNVFYSIEQNLL